MRGIPWKFFVNDAYLGIDAFLKYQGKVYQYAGWYKKEEQKCYAYVGCWTEGCEDFQKIWEVETDTAEQRWQSFLNAKIFDGKTLEEAGDDVEFLYWG